jgi:glucose-1-phosphate thymidylyltransferase
VSRDQSNNAVFGYHVDRPRSLRRGLVRRRRPRGDDREETADPKSNYAVTGLYFYDGGAVELGALNVELMGRGLAWLDTGTHASLIDAANHVRITEERQGLKTAVPRSSPGGWGSSTTRSSRR